MPSNVKFKVIGIKNHERSTTGLYCKIKMGKRKYKTQKLKKGDPPFWNESFPISCHCGDSQVIVECWKDAKMAQKKFRGRICFNVESLLKLSRVDRWFRLDSRGKKEHVSGFLRIEVTNADAPAGDQSVNLPASEPIEDEILQPSNPNLDPLDMSDLQPPLEEILIPEAKKAKLKKKKIIPAAPPIDRTQNDDLKSNPFLGDDPAAWPSYQCNNRLAELLGGAAPPSSAPTPTNDDDDEDEDEDDDDDQVRDPIAVLRSKAAFIENNITYTNNLIEVLKKKYTKALYQFEYNQKYEEDIKMEMEEICNKINDAIAKGFRELRKIAEDLNENSLNERELRMKMTKYSHLCHNLSASAENFKACQDYFRTKQLQRIKMIVPEASDQEVESAVDSSTVTEMTRKFADRKLAKNSLKFLEAKHDDLLLIETKVMELNKLFMEFQLVVEQNGVLLDNFEKAIEKSQHFAHAALLELHKSRKLKRGGAFRALTTNPL